MAEHTADYEWRGEGEEAEVVLYAPNSEVAETFFERALPAARLPGVMSPVYAAASSDAPRGFGWVASSGTYMSPDLISATEWGLLLVSDRSVERMGTPKEIPRHIGRGLSEVTLPNIDEARVRRLTEFGAPWAAEEGLIEEEDLSLLPAGAGDADALGRRSIAAGARDWTRPGRVCALQVSDVSNSRGAEALGLEPGALVLVVSVGAEDLGRLTLVGHRERISARTSVEDFGAPTDPPAMPADTEEAWDLLTATHAATNYAAGRAALVIYALRWALGDEAGTLGLQAAWRVGGLEERDEQMLHRNGLAAVGAGEALVAGRTVVAGTGEMLGSVPPFEAQQEEGCWVWEEAGVLARWATLERLGNRLGEVRG